jgi:hypothetical protein
MAMKYKRDYNTPIVITEGMKIGEAFQKEVTPEGPGIYIEMQGIYDIGKGIEIRFSNDYVSLNDSIPYICEIKSVRDESPDWYKASCIIGAAFYKALIMGSAKNGLTHLETAPFEYEVNGNITYTIEVPSDIDYILQFGYKQYKIELIDYKAILAFFEDKAIQSLDWPTAKQWDIVYHKNMWPVLKGFIQVTVWNPFLTLTY